MGTQTLCGTPGYVAPEVLNRQPYGVEIDVWSLGVIAYITLCGFPPFPLDMASNSVKKVKNAEFTYPMPQWQGISEDAKDFISQMIVVTKISGFQWTKSLVTNGSTVQEQPASETSSCMFKRRFISSGFYQVRHGCNLVLDQVSWLALCGV